MGEHYKIGTALIDPDGAVKVTTVFYEQRRAMLAAFPGAALENVLFNNAKQLFTGIRRS